MENINEALSLLLVGLTTVLIILSLVVLIGNGVIRFTNRFSYMLSASLAASVSVAPLMVSTCNDFSCKTLSKRS